MSASDSEPEAGVSTSAPTESFSAVTLADRTPSPGTGRHAGSAPDDADDRGSLEIADIVVEKVAVAAAGEVEHVGGVARRVLGIGGREDGDGRPRVTARVQGGTVSLAVRLTVDYPASVRSVSEATRAHVSDRVHVITELTVTRVDIDVAALVPAGHGASARPQRVVQ